MKDRHEALLAELADLGMSLARDLHARAVAASDDAVACDLSLAFHRISRSLRQTLALEARLEREQRLIEREARQDQAKDTLKQVQSKRRQVRNAVSALIWTEHEPDEAEELSEPLEALIWDQSEDQDAFLEAPLQTCIAHICEALGLPANDADAEDQPPPTSDEAPAEDPPPPGEVDFERSEERRRGKPFVRRGGHEIVHDRIRLASEPSLLTPLSRLRRQLPQWGNI